MYDDLIAALAGGLEERIKLITRVGTEYMLWPDAEVAIQVEKAFIDVVQSRLVACGVSSYAGGDGPVKFSEGFGGIEVLEAVRKG